MGFKKWRRSQQPVPGLYLTNLTLQNTPTTNILGLLLSFSFSFLKARKEIKMNDDKMSTWVGKQNSLKAPGQELTQFN